MTQPPPKRRRVWRNDHTSRFFLDNSHRRPIARAEMEQSTTLVESRTASFSDTKDARQTMSASFDMLSVEPRTTSIQSKTSTQASSLTSSHAQSSGSIVHSHTSTSEPIEHTTTAPVDLPESTPAPTENRFESSLDKPLQLQVEPTASLQRTTFFVPVTFSLPSSSLSAVGLSSLATSSALLGSSSTTVHQSTTWTRPIPSPTYSHSASATPINTVQTSPSHPHISPALIAFMVIGGTCALGLSLYVFRRVRYKALHVSRSQFQLASSNGHDGSTDVSGSESNNSFVSGGLGRLGQSNKQKNEYLEASGESPLWGGREKFSPQMGHGIVDFPPPVHLHTNKRLSSNTRRRSVIDTIRRNVPGRLSRYGAGWNAIPEPPIVPTVKITDVDTNHHRGASGSSFSGSPDPDLASIQVASVTRPLSATAIYRASTSPLPGTTRGLEHPRPAPKVPPRAPARTAVKVETPPLIPPVPKLPDISGLPTGQKKHTDANSRGKIDVSDISKPLPIIHAKSETAVEGTRAAGETDPMAMYAKYSVGLGVRNESPEMIRRETSMAQKIAQIANSNSSSRPTIAPTGSQSSLAKRDTRALAAAAGVTSPDPSEERVFSGIASASTSLPNLPGTPGLANVGNVMLRPYGQSGSMIPAYLETPAIGLDGRSSYLSTNLGPEAEWRNRVKSSAGPQGAINGAKAISESDIATLAPSATDDSDRRTILSQYSQDFAPLSQQAHIHQNPDYRSPTYSIYNYYGSNRTSRMPSMVRVVREEPEVGGAL
ncbi:hypothetical protein RhiXN_02044 [Rhizoctonia solani]|uniref:Uncharacterized protein n=1 Tax=Rhizoctonia solani TaxID=456999 RepID=A0A8H7HBM5_9AGAM